MKIEVSYFLAAFVAKSASAQLDATVPIRHDVRRAKSGASLSSSKSKKTKHAVRCLEAHQDLPVLQRVTSQSGLTMTASLSMFPPEFPLVQMELQSTVSMFLSFQN